VPFFIMSMNIKKTSKQISSAREDRERELYYMVQYLREQLKKKTDELKDKEIIIRLLKAKNKVLDEKI